VQVTPLGTRDAPTVDGDGRRRGGIEGVESVRLEPHLDHRGSLFEIINFDHGFWREPVVYAYGVGISPGRIKGWGMHKLQTDRYLIVHGTVRVVLYDGRDDSPTHDRLEVYWLSGEQPSLLAIPPGVWHADHNWGDAYGLIVNFPTRAYDRDNPDKYRLDPHSGEIAFDWSLRDS
jgi:dTDP-4-dehydrorhamnose 3,5-epimerase